MKWTITNFVFAFCMACTGLLAQMWNGTDTLYGNEWIRYGQPYFKILISNDGIYRIPHSTLIAQGIPLNEVSGAQFQLFWMGREVPLFVSTDSLFGTQDYIEFYGVHNRGELDRFLYRNPEAEMLNPLYSIVTDTSAYFLTWTTAGTPALRYQTVANDLSTLPPKEEWFWMEEMQVFSSTAVQKTDNQNVAESVFDEGEGFSSGFLNTATLNFAPRFVQNTAENSRFRLRLFANNRPHELRITINGAAAFSQDFSGYRLQEISIDKPTSALTNTESLVLTGANTSNDRYAIAWASLTYPRQFNFGGQSSFSFRIVASSTLKYLEISNFNSGNTLPVLYDPASRIRIVAQVSNGFVRIALPPAPQERHLILVNPSAGVRIVTTMQPVTFQDYRQADATYLIISHPRLFQDGNPVQEYATYRASEAGGSHRSLVLNVEELYNQFAYGVQRHPLAIRNAIHHFTRHWASPPSYALLIGRALQYNVGRSAAAVAGNFLVPTFGMPGSDNLLAASNRSNVPVLPIGRISAVNTTEVRQYLDKVIAHEQGARSADEQERAWKKEVIHLGGGNDAGEQQFIKNALAQVENTLYNSQMGANVLSLFKTNNDPIQQVRSDALLNRINNGAAIVTIYGHASPNSFDVAVDEPESYRNEGRYPALYSFGCYTGQVHEAGRSIGERFVFQDRKGMIAFFATTGLGGLSALNTLGQTYFNYLSNSMYGRGVGDVLQRVIEQYDQTGFFHLRVLLQQFTLLGDPALVITPYDAPDLLMRTAEAAVTPRSINAQADSVELRFVARNIGKAVQDSCYFEIMRQLPDGSQLTALRFRVPAPRYADEYRFQLPVFGQRAVGANRFYIKADTDDEILEAPLPLAERNNTLADAQGREGIDFFVFANGAAPLYPHDKGIVGAAPVTLKASTLEILAPTQRYIFELDTTLRFDSPMRIRHTVEQKGGLLTWTPSLTWRDSTVYYWRISPDSLPESGFNWRSSSFLYLNGSPSGWNQSHFEQWDDNRFISMEMSESQRRLKFLDDAKFVRVNNGVMPPALPSVNINNDTHPFIVWDGPVTRGLYIFSLDADTGIPWLNPRPGLYGSRQNTGWARPGHFPYWTTDQEWRQRAINFLRDTIPSGNYVVIYTVQPAGDTVGYAPRAWAMDSVALGVNLFQVLEAQGAQRIRSTAEIGPRPYILIYRKDDPTWPVIETLGNLNEPVFATAYINGRWDRGEVFSPRIGPARRWSSLHWKVSDAQPHDEWSIDLYGIRPDSVEVPLLTGITLPDTDLSQFSATEYPWLRLRFSAVDTLQRTSPHLPYWRVLYDGLPDAVLNPAAVFQFQRDTLQQGEPLQLRVAVSNAMPYTMDSLLMRYAIVNAGGAQQVIQHRMAPLQANDTLIASLQADTRQLQGLQQLRIEVNPDKDQPELHAFNNFGLFEFYVQRDQRNPLLEVTFDGIRIADGDLVSAKPLISIALRDENPWMRLQDTSLFKILLQYPNTTNLVPVPLDAPFVRFIPASAAPNTANRAIIEMTPHFNQSGRYALVVQARDASGNASGELDYRIHFEVINEARISNVLNYPNPFTTSTRFVYTLTGEEPPAQFAIRIMTVSGRIVRELTQADLGPLRIGTHLTDYAWDGTDAYGDRLANGVYLYQVVAKDREGKDLVPHSNQADGFFRNGIGKLVILR